MFSDYKAAIIDDYKAKRNKDGFSHNLSHPTPACIRDECLKVLTESTTKEDLKTLRLFFGVVENEEEYEIVIRHTDPDKFRPLVRFLRKYTTETHDKNIELLAWLIDFKPRPFKPGLTRLTNRPGDNHWKPTEFEKSTDKESDDMHGADKEEKKSGKGDIPPISKDYLTKAVILSVLIIAAIIILITQKDYNGCMLWNGKQYITADCDNPESVKKIGFQLNNQKSLTCVDTITEKHINKIWYIKNNNMIELFAVGGQYPFEPGRRLHLLSKYVFDKYVATKNVKVDCNTKHSLNN